MAYCSSTDLMLGDMLFSPGFNADTWIDRAADEMNAVLGRIYALPLPALSTTSGLILKQTNALIASGRIVLDKAISSESETLHAYGKALLTEGQTQLESILNGEIVLPGLVRIGSTADNGSGPSIRQADSESPFDAFNKTVMGGDSWYWRPG